EIRTAFAKCNLQRWDLMRTIRNVTGSTAPADGDIAAEYFGIASGPSHSINEKQLIVAADVAGQPAIWGEASNPNWLDPVSTIPPPGPRIALVSTFLAKSGRCYDDLFALLDLPFINPNGAIYVQHLDPSCDTDK